MNVERFAISDTRMDAIIGNLLRAGVIIASLIVLAGGAVYLAKHGSEPPNYRIFHGEPSDLSSIPGITRNASSLQGRPLIQFGILLLIMTPIMRVVFATVCFGLQKDRIYVGVTLIVLSVLLFSLAGGSR
jgi:uncharacterized membrane protein